MTIQHLVGRTCQPPELIIAQVQDGGYLADNKFNNIFLNKNI